MNYSNDSITIAIFLLLQYSSIFFKDCYFRNKLQMRTMRPFRLRQGPDRAPCTSYRNNSELLQIN